MRAPSDPNNWALSPARPVIYLFLVCGSGGGIGTGDSGGTGGGGVCVYECACVGMCVVGMHALEYSCP